MSNKIVVSAVMTIAAVAMLTSACKPKNGSELQTITGFDENGKAAALSLVPVRNFTVADLGSGSSDQGVRQAAAMVKTQLLALVECHDVKSKGGKYIRAADLMGAVQFRAAIDDLYVDEQRRLVTSASDTQLAAYGAADRKLVAIPCRVFGERLLSVGVLSDIQLRAAGLPKVLPSGNAERKRALETFHVGQAIYLSARGSYSKTEAFTPNVPAFRNMLAEQAGVVATVPALMKRLIAADAIYNVCAKGAPSKEYPWTDAEKDKSFTCEAQGSVNGLSNYRAGGDGKGYTAVRDLVAREIAGSHSGVHSEKGDNDKVLFALWEVVTSGRPWSRYAGGAKALATYLSTGKGFAFEKTFATNAKGAKPASLFKPTVATKYVPTAPLAFVLAAKGTRNLPIMRANAQTGADFSVLLGGSTSTADNRASSMNGRVNGVAEVLGDKAKAGMLAMWNKAKIVVQEVRTEK